MSNVDNPFGFKVINPKRIRKYYVPSAVANVFVGDLVKLGGSADANGIPSIALCTAGDTPCGVCVGPVHETKDNLGKRYSPTGANRYIMVEDSPGAICEIQAEETAAIAANDIGLNGTYVATVGSTSTGQSAFELDTGVATALATTSTLPLQLIGIKQSPDNALGINCVCLVRFNRHQFGRGSDDGGAADGILGV